MVYRHLNTLFGYLLSWVAVVTRGKAPAVRNDGSRDVLSPSEKDVSNWSTHHAKVLGREGQC